MPQRPCRSALYMPASNNRALEKAKTLAADAIIFDLEDAVAPEMKEMARHQAAAAITSKAYGTRLCVVRINSWESAWAQEDISAFSGCFPDAFLLPKVSSPDTLWDVARFLDKKKAPSSTQLWAMIETPEALIALESIARLGRVQEARLTTLVIGTNDLAKETHMRLEPDRAPLMPWLSIIAITAKAYKLTILDGVYNQIADLDGYKRECEQGRDLGFDGKTLIHPTQLALANQIFAPSDKEILEAEKIVALFELPENTHKNVVALDGRMVERLHLEVAVQTLTFMAAIKAGNKF